MTSTQISDSPSQGFEQPLDFPSSTLCARNRKKGIAKHEFSRDMHDLVALKHRPTFDYFTAPEC